jgi:F-type H+-transporting ATPase subunit gamma
MKMVAASKMRQDVARLERAKTFGVGSVQRIIDSEPYLAKKRPTFTAKKWLIVPLTSDKGLCGSVNSGIIREVKAMVKADRNAYRLFCVGDKGSVALCRTMTDIMDNAITHVGTPINFPTGTPPLIQRPPSDTRSSNTPRTSTACC